MKSSAWPFRALAISLGGFGLLLGVGLAVAVLLGHQYRVVAIVATPLPSKADSDLIKDYCVPQVVRAGYLTRSGATTQEEQEAQARESLTLELDEHAERIVITVSGRDPDTAVLLAEQLAHGFVEERNRVGKVSLFATLKGPSMRDLEEAERSAAVARRKAVRWLAQHHPNVLPEALRAFLVTHDANASASIAARFGLLSPAGRSDHELLEQAFFNELSGSLLPSPTGRSANAPNHHKPERTLETTRKRLAAEINAARESLEEETLAAGAAGAMARNAEFLGFLKEVHVSRANAKAIRSQVQTRPVYKPVASVLSVSGVPMRTPWWRHVMDLPRSVWVCQFSGIGLLMFGLIGCPGLPAWGAPLPEKKLGETPPMGPGEEVPDAW